MKKVSSIFIEEVRERFNTVEELTEYVAQISDEFISEGEETKTKDYRFIENSYYAFPENEKIAAIFAVCLMQLNREHYKSTYLKLKKMHERFPKNSTILEEYISSMSMYSYECNEKTCKELLAEAERLSQNSVESLFTEDDIETIRENLDNQIEIERIKAEMLPLKRKIATKTYTANELKNFLLCEAELATLVRKEEEIDEIYKRISSYYDDNNKYEWYRVCMFKSLIAVFIIKGYIGVSAVEKLAELFHQCENEFSAEIYADGLSTIASYQNEGLELVVSELEGLYEHFGSNETVVESFAWALQCQAEVYPKESVNQIMEKLLNLKREYPGNEEINSIYETVDELYNSFDEFDF